MAFCSESLVCWSLNEKGATTGHYSMCSGRGGGSAVLLRKLQPLGHMSSFPPDCHPMPAGIPDGWLGLPVSPIRAPMGTSLTRFVYWTPQGIWMEDRETRPPHTDHPRSPTVYNTPKMIGSVCLDPCWSQFCVHCHPMGNVLCCGGVRANKYSRSWALCPEDFKSSLSSKSTSATWTAWQRSRSMRKRKAMAASNCAVRNSTWK